ncbi:hypothetical protein ABVK25_012144 [Lepraria finkii]|uniref:Uncharacterized protein n=1 Tax=Lepraria finkii TaxID=1340010 RepID=A0ABR4AI01_9LECA
MRRPDIAGATGAGPPTPAWLDDRRPRGGRRAAAAIASDSSDAAPFAGRSRCAGRGPRRRLIPAARRDGRRPPIDVVRIPRPRAAIAAPSVAIQSPPGGHVATTPTAGADAAAPTAGRVALAMARFRRRGRARVRPRKPRRRSSRSVAAARPAEAGALGPIAALEALRRGPSSGSSDRARAAPPGPPPRACARPAPATGSDPGSSPATSVTVAGAERSDVGSGGSSGTRSSSHRPASVVRRRPTTPRLDPKARLRPRGSANDRGHGRDNALSDAPTRRRPHRTRCRRSRGLARRRPLRIDVRPVFDRCARSTAHRRLPRSSTGEIAGGDAAMDPSIAAWRIGPAWPVPRNHAPSRLVVRTPSQDRRQGARRGCQDGRWRRQRRFHRPPRGGRSPVTRRRPRLIRPAWHRSRRRMPRCPGASRAAFSFHTRRTLFAAERRIPADDEMPAAPNAEHRPGASLRRRPASSEEKVPNHVGRPAAVGRASTASTQPSRLAADRVIARRRIDHGAAAGGATANRVAHHASPEGRPRETLHRPGEMRTPAVRRLGRPREGRIGMRRRVPPKLGTSHRVRDVRRFGAPAVASIPPSHAAAPMGPFFALPFTSAQRRRRRAPDEGRTRPLNPSGWRIAGILPRVTTRRRGRGRTPWDTLRARPESRAAAVTASGPDEDPTPSQRRRAMPTSWARRVAIDRASSDAPEDADALDDGQGPAGRRRLRPRRPARSAHRADPFRCTGGRAASTAKADAPKHRRRHAGTSGPATAQDNGVREACAEGPARSNRSTVRDLRRRLDADAAFNRIPAVTGARRALPRS